MTGQSLTDQARAAFQELYTEIPETKGVIIATMDGLPLVSDFKGEISGDKLAALSATAVSIGKRILPSLGMGEMSELSMSSSDGKLFLYLVGQSAVLCLLTPRTVNVGMVFLKAGEIVRRLVTILERK